MPTLILPVVVNRVFIEINIDTIAQRYDAGYTLTPGEREYLYYLGHAHSDY